MRVFLDCGSHCGCSARKFFYLYGKEFVVHCFEPNRSLSRYYDDLDVTLHCKAVWIRNELRPFYQSTTHRQEGSSLIRAKCDDVPALYGRHVLDSTRPVAVQCIDLSNWLKRECLRSDTIHLKLDCAGAEYVILERLLVEDTIQYVDHLYIEWHWQKIGLPRSEHDRLVAELAARGIVAKTWNAMEPGYCRLLS